MFFADIFYISTPNKYSSHKNAASFIHYSYTDNRPIPTFVPLSGIVPIDNKHL
jgi:hypothetical protein